MSKLCEICGCEIPEGEEFEIDGQVLCHEHFHEMYCECDDCGAIVRIDDTTVTANGDRVCNDCLEQDYVMCDDCGEYYPQDETHIVNSGFRDECIVCNDCIDSTDEYFWCDHCEEYYTRNHLWAEDGSTGICDSCSDNYYVCADCGDIVHSDNVYWGDDDEPYCPYCRANHERDNRCSINDYGYKPSPKFGTLDEYDGDSTYYGSELTFGVELECDKGTRPGDAAAAVNLLTNRVYCKHDGSLDNGYEIVTHPGTLEWHMKVFPWKAICEASTSQGFKSHDAGTCGLHIHIGRDQLGETISDCDAAIARMIVLVDVLWPEIVRFSRRNGESRWAHRNDVLGVFQDAEYGYIRNELEAAREILHKSRGDGRYLAVNVQNNATVELRFNRGSLVPTTIYACLQLASNLAEFAKAHNMDECLDAKWDDVIHFHEYAELNDYVARRFAGWTPDMFRPCTDFRFRNMSAEQVQQRDVTSFEARCDLVAGGAEFYDAFHVLGRGDLVVLTRAANPVLVDDGPRVGSIGVVIRPADGEHWPLIMWNDREATLHDGHINAGLPRRCYYVPEGDFKVIRYMRNETAPYAEDLYHIAMAYGLVPGDLVSLEGRNHDYKDGVFYAVDGYTGYVAWPYIHSGHNGMHEMLANTTLRRGGWNFGIDSLKLA